MSAVPVIVLLSLVAFGLAETVAYIAMKGDAATTRRTQPE